MSHSNRHWPSMFKSKPCTTHHQWQHDLSPLMPNSGSKTPYASVGEEKSPEPKPRWNPKPEQIRILEAIFNSGVVNPPRDEIRRITCQLQEYGQVGDANVFYWFQNRKSRSKHKNRILQAAKSSQQAHSTAPTPQTMTQAAAPTSSSSSSEKSSPGVEKKVALNGVSTLVDMTNSPTASVNQTLFTPTPGDFLQEPFVLQVQQGSTMANGQCFSDLSTLFQMPDQSGSLQYAGLLHELMSQEVGRKEADEKMQMNYHSFVTETTVSANGSNETPVISGSSSTAIAHVDLQGVMAPPAAPRSMVSINGVPFEIGQGPLNVREAFGGDAVLHYTSGQPVPIDKWGLTLQPLQHGFSYYLV